MEQVGRYRILGELGRGAMGVVYKAQDPAIGRVIAIKSIRLNDLTDENERNRLRERLFREAQSAGILSHPGIVTIFDIFEESGLAYILMEFVNGPAFEKMLGDDQTADKDTLLSILRQIASALDYAHRKGIIHRDIKPANIMIHEDGSAKVTDFGIAKIASQNLTQAGTIMGTPTYMSPEQVQGIPVTGQADQFSLAVIAYEALTGEKPFTGEYLPTLLYKIVREDPIALTLLNPTLDAQVDSVVRRALSKRPEDRYPSCCEFVEALAEALNSAPGWTPFPRGASHHISTVGSQDTALRDPTADETIDHHIPPPVVEPPFPPAKPTTIIAQLAPEPKPAPPAWEAAPIHPPPESGSHVLRNVMLAALVVLLGVGGFIVYQQLHPQAAPVKAAVADTPVTEPTPQTIPPPPPVEAAPKNAAEPPPATKQVATVPAPVVTPANSDFEVTTTPPGATADFDDSSDIKCRTPCTVSLPAGRHTFVVTTAGYREARRILEIPRDTGLIVNLEKMQGTLSLVTTPPGSTVVLDGQEQTAKTPAVFQLPPGTHRVELVKGNDRQALQVEIHDGSTVTRTVEWQ